MERERVLKHVVSQGVDSDSMTRSIQQSEEFRKSISNAQCGYLSGTVKSLEGVLETIEQHDLLLGELSSYDDFNEYLADILYGPSESLGRFNRSKPGYMDEFLYDTELVDVLRELNSED